MGNHPLPHLISAGSPFSPRMWWEFVTSRHSWFPLLWVRMFRPLNLQVIRFKMWKSMDPKISYPVEIHLSQHRKYAEGAQKRAPQALPFSTRRFALNLKHNQKLLSKKKSFSVSNAVPWSLRLGRHLTCCCKMGFPEIITTWPVIVFRCSPRKKLPMGSEANDR